LSDAETYSRRLERSLLAYVGPGKKVEAINAGANAWPYSQMLVYFRDLGLRYQPDFVVLSDANLWTQFSERNSPETVWEGVVECFVLSGHARAKRCYAWSYGPVHLQPVLKWSLWFHGAQSG
jgi:hypothetical protein